MRYSRALVIGITGRFAIGGFTMIEMMIVLVVIAITAALSLPALSDGDDLRVTSAGRMLVADLLYAQNQAIATRAMQYVSFSLAGNGGSGGYSIYNQQPFTSPIINPSTGQHCTVTFGTGLQGPNSEAQLASLSLGGGNTVLAFDELGQPYGGTSGAAPVALSATGKIVLQCGPQTVTLSIEPDTGNITVSP